MAYKCYSDAFRTEAMIRLAVNRFDYEKTATQMGVTERSLRNWEKDFPKKGVPELLGRAIERMLMVIPDNWDGNSWAIALGILIDKWLLIQGEPTQRTENLLHTFGDLSSDERQTVVEEAKRILTGLSAGGSDSGEQGEV